MGVGGSKPAPQSRAVACFLDRRRRQEGTLESNRCFFPLGKTENRCGASGVFSLASISLSPQSDATWGLTPGGQQGTLAPWELPGSPRRHSAWVLRRLRARQMGNRSRLQRTRACLCSEARAGAPRRGRVKNNSIKTLKTFWFILGGGWCF